MKKFAGYFLGLILLTGCSQPTPAVTSTPLIILATNSVNVTPTEAKPETLPTQTVEFPARLQAGAGISFDEYNSILGSEPMFPSQKMAFSPDGTLLAAVGEVKTYERSIDGEIFFWDTENMGHSLKAYQSSMQHLESITFSNSGKYVAIGGCGVKDCFTSLGGNSRMVVFEWETGLILYSVENAGYPIWQIEFTPDDSGVIAQDGKDIISLWNLKTGELKHPAIDAMSAGAHGFAINARENYLAVGALDGVYILDLQTLATIGFKPEPRGQLFQGPLIAVSPDGKWLAASGCKKFDFETCTGREIYLWDNASSDSTYTFSLGSTYLDALTFDPGSNVLAEGSAKGISMRKAASGVVIKSPYASQIIYVFDIVFYPRKNKFAALTDEGIILGELAADQSAWAYTTLNRFGVGRKFVITLAGNNLNLHAEPALNSQVLKKLLSGENIKVVYPSKTVDGTIWWGVAIGGDETGWVVENSDWYAPVP